MKNITLYVICFCAVLLIAYDFWVGLNYGGNYTESWVILQLTHRYPIIAFVFGLLMGHLFWSQHGDDS